jgi:hypothetical protein
METIYKTKYKSALAPAPILLTPPLKSESHIFIIKIYIFYLKYQQTLLFFMSLSSFEEKYLVPFGQPRY